MAGRRTTAVYVAHLQRAGLYTPLLGSQAETPGNHLKDCAIVGFVASGGLERISRRSSRSSRTSTSFSESPCFSNKRPEYCEKAPLPGPAHVFWEKPDYAIVGTVLAANDDLHDNTLADSAIGPFSEIE